MCLALHQSSPLCWCWVDLTEAACHTSSSLFKLLLLLCNILSLIPSSDSFIYILFSYQNMYTIIELLQFINEYSVRMRLGKHHHWFLPPPNCLISDAVAIILLVAPAKQYLLTLFSTRLQHEGRKHCSHSNSALMASNVIMKSIIMKTGFRVYWMHVHIAFNSIQHPICWQ